MALSGHIKGHESKFVIPAYAGMTNWDTASVYFHREAYIVQES